VEIPSRKLRLPKKIQEKGLIYPLGLTGILVHSQPLVYQRGVQFGTYERYLPHSLQECSLGVVEKNDSSSAEPALAELTTGQTFKNVWAVSAPLNDLPGDTESEEDHFESHAAEMFGDGVWEPMEFEIVTGGPDGVFQHGLQHLAKIRKPMILYCVFANKSILCMSLYIYKYIYIYIHIYLYIYIAQI